MAAPVVALIDHGNTRIEAGLSASPPHSFIGVPTVYDLDIGIDDATHELLSAEFSFRFSDFSTDNKKRDAKMLRWMESETYPEARFTLRRVETGEEGRVAFGDLSMHGQVKEIAIPFTMETAGGRFVLDAAYTLDHREWGLEKIRLFIFTVDPVMEIRIHLEGGYAE